MIFPPRIGIVSLTGHGLNIIGESNVCFTFNGLKFYMKRLFWFRQTWVEFREKLGELPMNVPKMKIVLSENAVPFGVSTARQVPLCFQEAADKTVDDSLFRKTIHRIGVPLGFSSLSQTGLTLEWSRIILKLISLLIDLCILFYLLQTL